MNARVDAVLRAAVEDSAVPHVAAVAADDRGMIYEGAAGPVDADSVFRIASMTKIVCAVAALQQRDRGHLDFDAPVDTYCPEFAAVQVLAGFEDGKPVLRTPASRATVRQLLTHTTGLGYGFWNAELADWDDVFSAPMLADPGTRFVYGINADWLGKVVEVASGQSLDGYFAEHILAPLGMESTSFRNDDPRRCVPVHYKGQTWVATDLDWDQHPAWWSGGHGLYSTPRDFLRFQRMLLGAGTLAGRTILDRASVREAFTNQIGDLWFPAEIRTADARSSCDFVAGPGLKWGWGLLLNTRARPGLRSAGSGGWMGMFNTYFWVDPASRLTGAFYTQVRPLAAPPVLRAYEEFERAVYATR